MNCSSSNNDLKTTALLRSLLTSRIGLDPDVLGPSFLASIVQRCQLSERSANWHRLLESADTTGEAWQRLVKFVVVNETWFFRDAQPFDFIRDRVQSRWKGGHGTATRIFSCPCSTGEEPYSIAISLTAAGVPRTAFHIDAADVCSWAVHQAQNAHFSKRSFRGCGDVNLDPYFDPGSQSNVRQLKPGIRKMVHFRIANLLDLDATTHGTYDIILCRNLLIYQHDHARKAVLATLRAMLSDGGVLIVGHAEAAIAIRSAFRADGPVGAFAFTPRITSPRPAAPSSKPSRKTIVAGANSPQEHHSKLTLSLAQIRDLGDQGQLEAATRACHAYLCQVADSADGYYLLGVLLSASGNEAGAENAIRRAVYLDPRHPSALDHLSLLQEAKGNTGGAQRRRTRIRREA